MIICKVAIIAHACLEKSKKGKWDLVLLGRERVKS